MNEDFTKQVDAYLDQNALIQEIDFLGAKLALLGRLVHRCNAKWWQTPEGEPKSRNVGEILMLAVSELAEAGENSPQYSLLLMEITKSLCKAMEGHRKSKMDDKLPHRPALEVELADALIRILDMSAGLGLDIAGAFREKMLYNLTREDHTLEARRALGGKAY